jgi:hypothetical protein
MDGKIWWNTQQPATRLLLCVKLGWPQHLAFVSTQDLLEAEIEQLRNVKPEVLREIDKRTK